jgi:hypothetical protein
MPQNEGVAAEEDQREWRAGAGHHPGRAQRFGLGQRQRKFLQALLLKGKCIADAIGEIFEHQRSGHRDLPSAAATGDGRA